MLDSGDCSNVLLCAMPCPATTVRIVQNQLFTLAFVRKHRAFQRTRPNGNRIVQYRQWRCTPVKRTRTWMERWVGLPQPGERGAKRRRGYIRCACLRPTYAAMQERVPLCSQRVDVDTRVEKCARQGPQHEPKCVGRVSTRGQCAGRSDTYPRTTCSLARPCAAQHGKAAIGRQQ